MLGSIAGDIAGSPWEGGSGRPPRQFTLFGEDCVFTDDTVLTIAVADSILTGTDLSTSLRAWTLRYPCRGYGGGFIEWAHNPEKKAYGSAMNGAAMRVAAVGWLSASREECLLEAKRTAEVTHDHPDGIMGAQAIALAIWLARHNTAPALIRKELATFTGYDLSPSVTKLRNRGFGASTWASDSVPVALLCALDSVSWLDAVRDVVSIGGDCDTTACMAGGVAEAIHGLPPAFAKVALRYLPSEMYQVVREVYARANSPYPWEVSINPGKRALTWYREWAKLSKT